MLHPLPIAFQPTRLDEPILANPTHPPLARVGLAIPAALLGRAPAQRTAGLDARLGAGPDRLWHRLHPASGSARQSPTGLAAGSRGTR